MAELYIIVVADVKYVIKLSRSIMHKGKRANNAPIAHSEEQPFCKRQVRGA